MIGWGLRQKRNRARLPWRRIVRRFTGVAAAMAIVFTIVALSRELQLPAHIRFLERKTYDFRVSIVRGGTRVRPSEDILILGFDNVTLSAFATRYGPWPWPRRIHADMIRFLDNCGARLIVYTLVFGAPDPDEAESDRDFAEAFLSHDNVYLSMNLDNALGLLTQLGRSFTYEENIRPIEPLAIHVDTKLEQRKSGPAVDETGFHAEPSLTFNHVQPLLPELTAAGQRIGFVNHQPDPDNVSRRNPLVFRLRHELRANPTEPDASGPAKPSFVHFPHLALRLLLDRRYADLAPAVTFSADGRLAVGEHRIPLDERGAFLIKWYNVNVSREAHTRRVTEFSDYLSKLEQENDLPDDVIAARREQVTRAIEDSRQALDLPFRAQPYTELSAFEVIRAMDENKSGMLSGRAAAVAELLRDKIVFVGATATASYDVKYTPLHPHGAPGVLLQATLFDNLRQNTGYVRRPAAWINYAITIALCLATAMATLRFRSASAGVVTALALIGIEVTAAVLLFRQAFVWIDMAMPVIAVVLTTTVAFIAKYIGSDKAYRLAYRMATTDVMTGLYNHRYFQDQLRKSIAKALRKGHKFSLAMSDIDHFKKFNDTFGHQAGDEVLKCVAGKLMDNVREEDVCARYGGEEMAVILDHVEEEKAMEIGEKLVKAVAEEAYPIAKGQSEHVTISVGIATYPTHGVEPSDLIEFADKGMYRAKENGRNQVGAQHDTT